MDVFCRKELKFLVNPAQRQHLELALARRMVPDRFAHSSIRNLYYDTPDYRLIRRSLEKPVYKEKLRLRSYGNSQQVFLEMKKKYKGIVYKRRLAVTEAQAADFMAGGNCLPDCQIARELAYFRDFYSELAPRVYLSYERDAWHSQVDPGLRITLDQQILYRFHDLVFSLPPSGRRILSPELSLMEVKAENAIPLWLVELLNRLQIPKISFSKYGRVYETELLCQTNEGRGYHYVG